MIKIESPIYFSGKGKRDVNEDFVFPEKPNSSSNVFLVCDGLGGMVGGEIASKITGLAVHEYLSSKKNLNSNELVESINYANSLVLNFSKKFPRTEGMASTIAILSRIENELYAVWVGDSRIYQIRNGKVIFQSKDHSYKQLLLDNGMIEESEEYDGHVITQAIGGKSIPKPSIEKIDDIENGDYFVLVTDGVLEAIPEKSFHSYFEGNPQNNHIVQKIISQCHKDSKDNFSLYVFNVFRE